MAVVSTAVIATFVAEQTLSYAFAKVLEESTDFATFKEKYSTRLYKVINSTIDEYAKHDSFMFEPNDIPFYLSETFMQQLSSFMLFGEEIEIDLSDAIKQHPDLVPPMEIQIECFKTSFLENIENDALLKDLFINENYKRKVFVIGEQMHAVQEKVDAISIGLDKQGIQIDQILEILKEDKEPNEDIWRIKYRKEDGDIVTSEKSLEEFLAPRLQPLQSEISRLENSLQRKEGEKEELIAKIATLEKEMSRLRNGIQKLLSFISSLSDETINADDRYKVALSKMFQNDLDAALDIISEELLEQDESSHLKRAKALSNNRLLRAKILSAFSDIEGANANFEKSIALVNNFKNNFHYADFLQYQKEFAKAAIHYVQGINLTDDDVEKGDAWNNLGNTIHFGGVTGRYDGDEIDAEFAFLKALKFRKSAAKGKPIVAKIPIAKSLNGYATHLASKGQLSDARKLYLEAEQIHDEVFNSSGGINLYSNALFLANLGGFLVEMEEAPDAVIMLEKSLKRKKEYLKQNPDKNDYDELPVIKTNLALAYLACSMPIKAQKQIESTVSMLLIAFQKLPTIYGSNYGKALITEAKVHYALSKEKEPKSSVAIAKDKFQMAIDLIKDLYQSEKKSNLELYSSSLTNYANFLTLTSDYKEALDSYKIQEELLVQREETHSDSAILDLARNQFNIGIAYHNIGNRESRAYFKKCLNTLEDMNENTHPNYTFITQNAKRLLKGN